MTDPYVMGPGPDYTPLSGPAVDHVDPEVQARIDAHGREAALAALAAAGIHKTDDGRWTVQTTEENP
jgi:hypothetical protein